MDILELIIGFIVISFFAILPGAIIGKYILKKDKEKKPTKLIVKLIIFGALSVVLTAVLEEAYNLFFPNQNQFFQLICKSFIGIALIEEISKFLPTYFIGVKDKQFSTKYDAIVYAVFSAIGFATFENLLYCFLNNGIHTAMLRFYTAIPGHICDAAIMGCFIGTAYKYKYSGNKKRFRINMICSILIPTIIHGLYDFGLLYGKLIQNNSIKLITYYSFIILIIFVFLKVKSIAKNNEKFKKII